MLALALYGYDIEEVGSISIMKPHCQPMPDSSSVRLNALRVMSLDNFVLACLVTTRASYTRISSHPSSSRDLQGELVKLHDLHSLVCHRPGLWTHVNRRCQPAAAAAHTEWAIIPKTLQTHVPKTRRVIFHWPPSKSAVKHQARQGRAIFAEGVAAALAGWNMVWCFAPLRGIMCMTLIKSHPMRRRIAMEFSNQFQFHLATAVI